LLGASPALAEDLSSPMDPTGGMRDIVVPSPCPGPECRPPTDELAPAAQGPRRVFVNFDAITLNADSSWEDARDNTSLILVTPSKTLPGLRISDPSDGGGLSMSQIEDIIIERMYALYLPYEVELVTSRPSSGNYHMIVFGSTCQQVAGEDCAGISLGDCDDYMPNNVSFVFPTGMEIDDIATTAAHEVGHAFGLGHIDNDEGVMYPSIQWVPPSAFEAGTVPDSSGCGSSYQDSDAVLMSTIGARGADFTPPSVTITSPADGAVVKPGATISVSATDNLAVRTIQLFVAGDLVVERDDPPFEFYMPGSVADGVVVIMAKAYDGNDNMSSHRIVVTVDRTEPECAIDADCPDGKHCESEFCVPDDVAPDLGELGDPCTSNADCSSGTCAQIGSDARCTQECTDDGGCPGGFECRGAIVCWPAEPDEEGEPAKNIFTCAVSERGSTPTLLVLLLAFAFALRRRR
jgi:MYXO-CTERM domain-containing protein